MKKLWVVITLGALVTVPTTTYAAPIYTFPVAGCTVKYGKYHHTCLLYTSDAADE